MIEAPSPDSHPKGLFRSGRNCWRVEPVDRAAFLIDARAYFEALHDALSSARRCIRILGWDIDSRLALIRPEDGRRPTQLRDLLGNLARKRPELSIDILTWDFSVLYSLEREWLTKRRFGRSARRRIRFELDSHHPIGASQHQKLVVVDDRVAFVGGLDLTQRRWDTPEHAPWDERRVDPGGKHYAPFHDVQMLVDGGAARALAELAVERWRKGTERASTPLADPGSDPWPSSVEPTIRNTRVAIARTLPRYGGRPQEAREVERLHLDLIASARRWIYCENQYLTSERVSRAFAARLREEEGPELVLVTSRETRGWLERTTMDVLRARFLKRLHEADRHGRLRVVYPHVPGLDEQSVMVHAKVTVVDDRIARVGSSNLSNRSMGLDSECDLAVEYSASNPAVADLRDRLMAEHLGVEPAKVAGRVDAAGSIVTTLDELSREGRGLRRLDERVSERLEALVPESAAIDPEQPIESIEFLREYLSVERGRGRRRFLLRLAILLAVVAGAAAAWRWTPLGEHVDADGIRHWMTRMGEHPVAPLLVPLIFVAAGFLGVPVTGLIGATGAVFGPWKGMALSLAGSLLSATATFGVAKWAGRSWTQRFAGSMVRRVDRWLSRGGVPAVAALRLAPIAPFSVVNLALGASSLTLRTYLLGTLAGMLPGIVALSWVGDRLAALLERADTGNLTAAGAVTIIAAAGLWLARRWLLRRKAASGGAE